MAKKFIDGTEIVPAGFANGISLQLASKEANKELSTQEKKVIIVRAAKAFGGFLTA